MGDVGDYWREHKAYVDRKKYGKLKDFPSDKPKKTLQCECGKWFRDETAHRHHKQAKGKKGHKLTHKPEDL